VDKEQYRIDLAVAISKVMLNKDTISYEYDAPIRVVTYGDSRIQLEFKPSAVAGMPEMPRQPGRTETAELGMVVTTTLQKEMLQKNLKVLRMTTQEEVSGSTYGALIEFL